MAPPPPHPARCRRCGATLLAAAVVVLACGRLLVARVGLARDATFECATLAANQSAAAARFVKLHAGALAVAPNASRAGAAVAAIGASDYALCYNRVAKAASTTMIALLKALGERRCFAVRVAPSAEYALAGDVARAALAALGEAEVYVNHMMWVETPPLTRDAHPPAPAPSPPPGAPLLAGGAALGARAVLFVNVVREPAARAASMFAYGVDAHARNAQRAAAELRKREAMGACGCAHDSFDACVQSATARGCADANLPLPWPSQIYAFAGDREAALARARDECVRALLFASRARARPTGTRNARALRKGTCCSRAAPFHPRARVSQVRARRADRGAADDRAPARAAAAAPLRGREQDPRGPRAQEAERRARVAQRDVARRDRRAAARLRAQRRRLWVL